jgi:hypothetical protein
MLLSIHQPNYWPYPGVIGKIAQSDEFMFLTKVKLEKTSWQVRNRIRNKEGWNYFTVPVISKGKCKQRICDTKILQQKPWRKKHLKGIRFAYENAPYYKQYEAFIVDLYEKEWEYLAELDIYIMEWILKELSIKTKLIYDRDLELNSGKNELLIDACHQLGATSYMSNKGSENYVEIEKFNQEGIDHIYIDYREDITYPQVFDGFEPGLSILDMLMNCGTERTKEIILNKDNYRFSEWNQRL